jgi:sortase A
VKRRLVRAAGTALIVAGLGLLGYVGVVWIWQDPATGLYTRWQQRNLADDYDQRVESYRRAVEPPADVESTDWAAQLRRDAKRYRTDSGRGDAIGRLEIPRLDLDMLLVNGTDATTLKKGPGRYAGTERDLDSGSGTLPRAFMPGEGERVYVAGHRTTYQAPFSRINRMRRGDSVTLELPYARFVYRVTGHRIVASDQLAVLESRGHEQLVLQACHPRFFASQRYIVFATPVRVTPSGSERGLSPAALAAAG